MKGFGYIFRRLVALIPVTLGVLIIVFVIGRIVPADPLSFFIGQEADAELIERIRNELHLDEPLWTQFYYYVQDILNGSLGMSWSTRNPVSKDLMEKLPATFELILVSLIVTVVIAIPLGVIGAVKRDSVTDHFTRIVSLSGVSMPGFWVGLLLIFFLYYLLGWTPPPMGRIKMGLSVERVTGFYLIDTLLAGDLEAFGSVCLYLISPVSAIAFRQLAQLTRLVRSTMIEVLNSDYIQAARSQGLRSRMINYRLALKNAMLPPVTQIGLIAGNLIGVAVIIEIVFAWPGAGSWAVDAALAGDFAPVQAFAVIAAIARVLIFLVADIAYTKLDPRITF
ncbi:MAG: ABC transporter permease [Deltaproteobacteria bacterium]|nr:ABC transporter permease [Deltaproteobacteria bacterium]